MIIKKNRQGFTLLELLIVLVLIGLITGLSVPYLGGSLGGTQLKSSANRIGAILRYARNLTVSEQYGWTVAFEFEQQRVVLAPSDVEHEEEDKRERIYQLPEGVFLVSEGNEDIQILFYPAGNSSGGEIELRGKSKIRYRISVDFITGIVDVTVK